MPGIKIFTGSSHPELTGLILDRLGIPPSPAVVKRFPNAETSVELGVSVRDADVFLIQSGSHSMNDHLMELLIMISSCRSASARRITAVLPYFPYNKQSKKKKARGAISAKLVASMLSVAGVDHVITLELHSSLTQGFFNKPCDNLLAQPILAKYISDQFQLDKCIMVSKNAGGTRRVAQLADVLKIDFALIHRERYHIREGNNVTEEYETKLSLVGDVNDKICLVLDDVIDGTHSFIDSCEHLKKCSAAQVYIIAVHGILSGNALRVIENCDAINGIIVTNSYPLPAEKKRMSTKLVQIDISGLLAEAIRRTHNGEITLISAVLAAGNDTAAGNATTLAAGATVVNGGKSLGGDARSNTKGVTTGTCPPGVNTPTSFTFSAGGQSKTVSSTTGSFCATVGGIKGCALQFCANDSKGGFLIAATPQGQKEQKCEVVVGQSSGVCNGITALQQDGAAPAKAEKAKGKGKGKGKKNKKKNKKNKKKNKKNKKKKGKKGKKAEGKKAAGNATAGAAGNATAAAGNATAPAALAAGATVVDGGKDLGGVARQNTKGVKTGTCPQSTSTTATQFTFSAGGESKTVSSTKGSFCATVGGIRGCALQFCSTDNKAGFLIASTPKGEKEQKCEVAVGQSSGVCNGITATQA
ncbi:hypothetical protein HDV06_002665 [Boothiomyces sp. JEL0866]|nr:hypothetical protein HDV06_002665 [Boothiomyces sp. JEL0866]